MKKVYHFDKEDPTREMNKIDKPSTTEEINEKFEIHNSLIKKKEENDDNKNNLSNISEEDIFEDLPIKKMDSKVIYFYFN